ncbi:MAG: serpin family protein [Planctomycetes bacterium]|nr:serpin family protein [Planctomycetota bacterium]
MRPTRLLASLLAPALTLPCLAQKPPTDTERLAAACNAFAADLHAALGPTQAPTCSPGSIAIALLMLLPGAAGATADEIATVLHLPDDLRGNRMHEAARDLLQQVGLLLPGSPNRDHEPSPLALTNDLWVQRGFALVPSYPRLLRASFGAAKHDVDFAADPDKARTAINLHVAQATGDRIRELLAEDDVNALTRVVLTNALWFKAGWAHAFTAGNTQDLPFTLADGTTVPVPTMQQQQPFGWAESDAWVAVSMPFAIGTVQFEAVVPRDGHTLAEAERALLQRSFGKMANEPVQVALPRFLVQAAHRLRTPLLALGMRRAFDASADFSGIEPKRELFVDDVVHQTWIQVDEQGCEAAAATAVVLKVRSAVVQGQPKQFRADRPFAFGLRDARTGLLLFVGRVTDPRSRQS